MSENTTKPAFDPAALLPIEPVQLFDDYYFVGNKLVGFHILKTSRGLVLFDAMDKYNVDEKFLIPGLKKLGLENEKILMLFLTHAHHDHYMGAEMVRLRTGCDVALSEEDTVFMVSGPDGFGMEDMRVPRITRILRDGEDLTFGEHTVHVISAPGHTPGCLNYSFEVHDRGVPHRVVMMGGYGVFGPGNYPRPVEYPYGVTYAVEQALTFAASCVKTWEYAKETGCDVFLNPHPHLCSMLELAARNEGRGEEDPNALVTGLEGVRKMIVERFDVCMESALRFTDIRKEIK